MLVKVCGITRAEDAAAAVAYGAAAIGFIFWPGSPRYIEAARARDIVRTLPAFVTAVGVFVNQSVAAINEVVAVTGISAVQLHGDELPETAGLVSRPVIKGIGRLDDTFVDSWPTSIVMLVDAHDPQRRGGTGQTADWPAAARLAARRRIVLAGGLNAGNVAAAVQQVRPFGIDVSSGVESSPGIKDHRRIADFFEALQRP